MTITELLLKLKIESVKEVHIVRQNADFYVVYKQKELLNNIPQYSEEVHHFEVLARGTKSILIIYF